MPETLEIHERFASPHAVQALWPLLSKTDWVNRAVGLPEVRYEIEPMPEGGTRVTANATWMGLHLRWIELPFEWEEGVFYRVRRLFEGGPFVELACGTTLHPVAQGGTEIEVFARIEPRHRFGRFLARRIVGPKTMRDMGQVIEHTNRFLAREVSVALPRLPVHAPRANVLAAGLRRLKEEAQPERLVNRLELLLTEAPDVELAHIRPFAMARQWEEDRWATLRLFLQGTRAGLLNLAWEVLCPNCRSSRQTPSLSLGKVSRTAHCEVCNIRYDAEFDRSVELKFSVHPSVRPVDARTFCLAGPGGRPHAVGQVVIDSQQSQTLRVPADAGVLRLRSPQVREVLEIPTEEHRASRLERRVECHPDGFKVSELPAGAGSGSLQLVNDNAFPVTVVLERVRWDADILTAARVTNWQEFRDLFAREIISPSEEVTVGTQIVLFTDLRGSTALYNTIGDAPAYALVRDHFDVLRRAVAEHHGAVVKTIGDAVMAVFTELAEALAAVGQMHAGLRQEPRRPGMPELLLKSALHAGPCLAVNANDRLDFFGTTINLAARLVDHCQGGDLTVSDEVFRREETQTFLQSFGGTAVAGEKTCRGFDQPVRVWRIPMAIPLIGH